MKATLTSINKPHTDNIFTEDDTRKKIVEWRTKPLPKGLHYVYETKNKGGCGKVIGEMTVVGWRKFESVSEIPNETLLKGRVGARQLDIYAKGRPLYANVIVNAKRYDEPKRLIEFKTPPCEKSDTYCCKCKYFEVHNTPEYYETDCWGEDGVPITRPPQSYMYCAKL